MQRLRGQSDGPAGAEAEAGGAGLTLGERRGVSPPWIAMTLLRRLIAWIFYFGFVSAVGAGVFMLVRYRPRCTIVLTRQSIMHLSADGSRLVTLKQRKPRAGQGPLTVWDTQNGEIAHEMLGDVDVELRWERSPDDRHFAISLADGKLRLVDWRTGEVWPFEEPNGVQYFYMSPKGRWLFVVGAAPRGSVIVDLKTRQITLRLDEQILRFSADDRWGFARQSGKAPIDVWDLAATKKITTIATDGSMLASPDGASLVTWSPEHNGLRSLEFWTLPSGRKRCQFDFTATTFSPAFFSFDSRFLAILIEQEKTAKVVLLDVETGQKLWEAMAAPNSGDFSPDSAVYLNWYGDQEQTFTMHDVATGRKLWERQSSGVSMTRFTGESGNLLFQELNDKKPLLFLDARTGEAKQTGAQNFRTGYNFPFLTPENRHFVLDGWQLRDREPHFWESWLEKRWPELFSDDSKVAVVVESATGCELFRIRRVSWGSMLSTDATTLVTLDNTNDDETVIRAWDVHPRRAWTWALSSVAATMFLCFCLSRSLRALRHRKKTCAPVTY